MNITVAELSQQLQDHTGWFGVTNGLDLHELMFVLTGEPSPDGSVTIDSDAIHRIAREGQGTISWRRGCSAQQAARDLVAASIV